MTGSREGAETASGGWLIPDEATELASRRAIVELTRESESGMDFLVRGDCMVPMFEQGDRVRIEARRFYLPGDVIAYLESDPPEDVVRERLLVHRLLGYDRRDGRWYLVTGADAASGFDPPVTSDKIMGRVTAVARANQAGPSFVAARPGLVDRLRALMRFVRLARLALGRRLAQRKPAGRIDGEHER